MNPLLLSLASTMVLAQEPVQQRPLCWNARTPMTQAHGHERPIAIAEERSAAAVLWSEDFESGMGGWTVNTQTGAVSWQLTSTGNTGGYTPGPLQSTTGYPGGTWIVADSDEQGTAGVAENTTITSPPITGLDTVPFMLLRFEQSFRQLNNDITQVEVSSDGGTNWTVFPVNGEVPGNQSTPGAPVSHTLVLNISAALNGGSGDIRIRFHWLSFEGYTYSFTVIGAIGLQGIRLINPTFGETIVVTGLGLIGLISGQLLLANGCRVIGLDFDQSKVELAKSFGIEAYNVGDGTNPVTLIGSLTHGIWADGELITASTKSNEVISQSAGMCRKKGRIVLVGVVGLDINRSDFFKKELSFQVSCSYGPGRYDEDYEEKGQDYPIGYVWWTCSTHT